MTRKVKEFRIFEKLTIESAGAEGHSIGRHDGQVIFVKYAAPGDVVDVQIVKKKKKKSEINIQIKMSKNKSWVEIPLDRTIN